MCSESAHYIYVISCSQDPLAQESRTEMRIFLLTIMTSVHIGKFVLPISATIGSDGLEVLVPKGKGLCQETQQIFY